MEVGWRSMRGVVRVASYPSIDPDHSQPVTNDETLLLRGITSKRCQIYTPMNR